LYISRTQTSDRHMKTETEEPFSAEAFLAKANGGKTISNYPVGTTIYVQGDLATSLFYLQSGKIKISVISEQGKEAVVAILGAGEFFGEGAVASQPKRMATSTAMEECVVVEIGKTEALRVLHDEPSFSARFISHLLARNMRVEEDLVDQLFNSSEKRLARVLLLLANFGKENGPQPVIGKFTQETLADMIGTTRARVSFFMNKFRKLGLIEYNGNIKVHASLLNVLLHDKPQIRGAPKGEDKISS
jgi:CRP/FNR family cyclic AMP-dependent transcriptional regulator